MHSMIVMLSRFKEVGGNHIMILDWNIIFEIVLGVIIYKIVDSLFNVIFRVMRKMFARIVK